MQALIRIEPSRPFAATVVLRWTDSEGRDHDRTLPVPQGATAMTLEMEAIPEAPR